MSNWKVIYDNNSGKIVTDEPTDENCWDFYHSSPTIRGFGSISTSRELCLKKIIRVYKKKITDKEKELNKMKRFLKKVERELSNE